jgi:hypothetical protein
LCAAQIAKVSLQQREVVKALLKVPWVALAQLGLALPTLYQVAQGDTMSAAATRWNAALAQVALGEAAKVKASLVGAALAQVELAQVATGEFVQDWATMQGQMRKAAGAIAVAEGAGTREAGRNVLITLDKQSALLPSHVASMLLLLVEVLKSFPLCCVCVVLLLRCNFMCLSACIHAPYYYYNVFCTCCREEKTSKRVVAKRSRAQAHSAAHAPLRTKQELLEMSSMKMFRAGPEPKKLHIFSVYTGLGDMEVALVCSSTKFIVVSCRTCVPGACVMLEVHKNRKF